MKIPSPIVIDFETEKIQPRPCYPPIPVGVSIQYPGLAGEYFAWGHPTGNNCSKDVARAALGKAWNSGESLLFHHAKFDTDVAETYMGMRPLPWHQIHDTLYLLFLQDPHQQSFALKPAAERLLGMPAEERDEVRQWLVDNRICKHTGSDFGAFISQAPGDLVGRYANGDTSRTYKLFRKVYKEIVERGMLLAYDRERELMPILLANEREGVCVDEGRLRRDTVKFKNAVQLSEQWLRKRLKTPELNFEAPDEVADALEKTGVVTEWNLTPTGKRSVSKKNLTLDMFTDTKVAVALGYRNRLTTCISMFAESWLQMADGTGKIFTNWNQVRQTSSDGAARGAATGRQSSNPNFQNLPTDWYTKDDDYTHPKFLNVPELPLMRGYILPDPGEVWCCRDYNQQELRILAHYEDGSLLAAYQNDPRLDVHAFVQNEIERLFGIRLDRHSVKVLNFGMVYGMGIAKLAADTHRTVDEAKELKNAQQRAIPGLPDLEKGVKALGRAGKCIRTWGGREYFAEQPKRIGNRLCTFEYKLLNYLIQGSAGDCTKQAIINYHNHPKRLGRFLISVHDEINTSNKKKNVREDTGVLEESMLDINFDVPMVSDCEIGPNWADICEPKWSELNV